MAIDNKPELDSSHSRWPDCQQYHQIKDVFLRENKQWAHFQLATWPIWQDLSLEQKGRVDDLINYFQFGVNMVYKKFGEKYSLFKVGWTIDNDTRRTLFYDYNKKFYVFNLAWVKEIVTHPPNEMKIYDRNLSLSMPLLDNIELGGVEEAAHYLLDANKPDYFKSNHLLHSADSNTGPSYASQDHETKALLWQLSYARHYFPQYYPAYKNYYDRVIAFRKSKFRK